MNYALSCARPANGAAAKSRVDTLTIAIYARDVDRSIRFKTDRRTNGSA
jgi:hypothetical protein